LSEVYALIVVDTDAALSSGSLMGNAYLVDTNGFLGSWNEGTPSLRTVCQEGQVAIWSATALRVDASLSITGFSGSMVDQGICRPTATGPVSDQVWSGMIEPRGLFASVPYTIALSIDGSGMSLNSAVKVI